MFSALTNAMVAWWGREQGPGDKPPEWLHFNELVITANCADGSLVVCASGHTFGEAGVEPGSCLGLFTYDGLGYELDEWDQRMRNKLLGENE
jgi:hypothetical protein